MFFVDDGGLTPGFRLGPEHHRISKAVNAVKEMNMKKLLIVPLLLILAGIAKAQTTATPATIGSAGIGVPLADLNLSQITTALRADFVLDQHGVKWGGLHVPLADYHDSSKDEIVNVNLGLMWAGQAPAASSISAGAPSGINSSISVRLDYLAKKANGNHITMAALPKIELGPMGGYLSAQHEWIYGVLFATTFGQ